MRPRVTGALTAVAVLVLGLGGLAVSAAGDDGTTFEAEFTNAHGLVSGNDVRIDGAPVGTVSEMELTDAGTAMVTIDLRDGIPAPRADASAAVRPVDLLGDNYVALDEGDSPQPLRGPIGTDQTLNAPRLDDLLRTFGDRERAGLKALLVESGVALDQRGADLNATALRLRPALEAADSVTTELGSQSASLKALVTDGERASSQAASRNEDLGRLVGAFDSTLQATADNSDAFDQTLADLPRSLGQVRTTTAKLTGFARAATPVAESLDAASPKLVKAARRIRPFLRTASQATRDLHPTLSTATRVLADGDPAFAGLAEGLTKLKQDSPTLDSFLDVLGPAAPKISEGFFVNFPDQAAEPGNQPLDPTTDPRRHYWRGAALLTCQTFGRPIQPGCLTDFLLGP
jgi:phospholipid/cholesterol/gamma-HCH transport system substrate-binding protein